MEEHEWISPKPSCITFIHCDNCHILNTNVSILHVVYVKETAFGVSWTWKCQQKKKKNCQWETYSFLFCFINSKIENVSEWRRAYSYYDIQNRNREWVKFFCFIALPWQKNVRTRESLWLRKMCFRKIVLVSHLKYEKGLLLAKKKNLLCVIDFIRWLVRINANPSGGQQWHNGDSSSLSVFSCLALLTKS